MSRSVPKPPHRNRAPALAAKATAADTKPVLTKAVPLAPFLLAPAAEPVALADELPDVAAIAKHQFQRPLNQNRDSDSRAGSGLVELSFVST